MYEKKMNYLMEKDSKSIKNCLNKRLRTCSMIGEIAISPIFSFSLSTYTGSNFLNSDDHFLKVSDTVRQKKQLFVRIIFRLAYTSLLFKSSQDE